MKGEKSEQRTTFCCESMSGTPTTWSNPLRSISRTSSVASTVSSVAADDSAAGDPAEHRPPVESVSTTSRVPATEESSAATATTATTATPNKNKKDDKDSPPRKSEQQVQPENNVANNSDMIPLTTTAANSFLSGKLVLVTGGSGVIGTAIATALVKSKASVVLTGRNVNRLKRAVERIRAACPDAPENSVKLVSCDVAKEDSVKQLFNTLDVYKDKRVDILINNAGINIPGATEDLTALDFQSVMAVNVLGPFLCSREVMKRMRASGLGGRIINIASLSAHCPRPDSAPYTTSKFALRGLTQSLALDGRAHNIAVGMIHPGNVQSELLTLQQIQERQDEGFLQAEQVADCVVYMCSLPYSVNVQEMTVMPTTQPFVGRG